MRFANFHAHVLHGVDDGPETKEEALALAEAIRQEGCDRLVVTPHFSGARHDFVAQTTLVKERFLQLQAALRESEHPFASLLLGYEVRYFPGISRSELLGELCFGDSSVLLLELDPFALGDRTVAEIEELHYAGYTVLLAHLERYTKCAGYGLLLPLLREGYAIPQVNADALVSRSLRRAALGLIKSQPSAILSSDAHSLDRRPPLMRSAFATVQKHLGEAAVLRLIQNGDALFAKIEQENDNR